MGVTYTCSRCGRVDGPAHFRVCRARRTHNLVLVVGLVAITAAVLFRLWG